MSPWGHCRRSAAPAGSEARPVRSAARRHPTPPCRVEASLDSRRGTTALEWHCEPPAWTDRDGTITVLTGPGTDFWRATRYGFISGAYADLYDQAGLMLRLDERNWMKCGIEYVHGAQQVNAVVTRDHPDWSVVPAPGDPPQAVFEGFAVAPL